MAYICTKPKGSCKTCEHYRFDTEENRHACFAVEDAKKKSKSYVVSTVLNHNTCDDTYKKIFNSYTEAKAYFDKEVKSLIESYMNENDTLENWLSVPGIITTEYGGLVENGHVSFDCNSVLIEELN